MKQLDYLTASGFLGNFIIIIGGMDNSLNYLDDVEVLSLDPSNPVPDCLTPLNPFPTAAFGSGAALDYSGTWLLIYNATS